MRNITIIALAPCLSGCLTLAAAAGTERGICRRSQGMRCDEQDYFGIMQCENAAENRIVGRETALVAFKHPEFLKIALRLDKGEIGKEQALIETGEVNAIVKAQAEQMAAADAERRAAMSAALINAGATLLAANLRRS